MSEVVLQNGVDSMNMAKEDGGVASEHLSNGDDTNDNTMVIHNNLYPTACSNTVTVRSVIIKKPQNVTSVEMRSSGTVPKRADIENYLSTATFKT